MFSTGIVTVAYHRFIHGPCSLLGFPETSVTLLHFVVPHKTRVFRSTLVKMINDNETDDE